MQFAICSRTQNNNHILLVIASYDYKNQAG